MKIITSEVLLGIHCMPGCQFREEYVAFNASDEGRVPYLYPITLPQERMQQGFVEIN